MAKKPDYEFPEGAKLYFVSAGPHPKKHFNRAGLRFDATWRPILVVGTTTDLQAPIPIVSPADFARIERETKPQTDDAGAYSPPLLAMQAENATLGREAALEWLDGAMRPTDELELLRRENAELRKTNTDFEERLLRLELGAKGGEKGKAKP